MTVLPRAAAVAGAVLIVLAVVLRVWWVYRVADPFVEEGGRIGLYHGTWYAAPFGHDAEMTRFGSAASALGAIAFFAGLVAASALLMTSLASGDRIKPFAAAAQLACAACLAAALGALVAHENRRGAEIVGIGPLLLGAGTALGIVGARLTRGGRKLAIATVASNAVTIAACALAVIAITSHGFWIWQWSDERSHVGLVEADRCWRGLDHCSTERMNEPFMLDNERISRFERTARQTHDAAFAVVVLAVIGLVVRRRRIRDVAHAPWIVLLLLTTATLAMTPDEGTARHVHIGYAFPLLFIACAAGTAGAVLRE